MEDLEAALSPISLPPLVDDLDDSFTLAEEAGSSTAVDPEATTSPASSSPGSNVPIIPLTPEPCGSESTCQASKYFSCPKNCGFHSRNQGRVENHQKNCWSATTKKVETNRKAPRADGVFNPPMAVEATAEPSKILRCLKCHYKTFKKAHMDIHNCLPVPQLKPKDKDSVSKEPTKQPKPTKSTQLKAKQVRLVPEFAANKKELAKQLKPKKSTLVALPPLKCSFCGFFTTDRNFLANHEKMHVVQSKFSCSHCTYSVGHQGLLARHTSRQHPELRTANNALQLPNVEQSKERPLQELPKEIKERNILKPQRKVLQKGSVLKGAPLSEDAPKKSSSRKEQLPKEIDLMELNKDGAHFQPPEKKSPQNYQKPNEGHGNSQQLLDGIDKKDVQLQVGDVDPPKENMKPAKPLVMILVDQLQDLGAAEDKELPDLSLDYFQELEDIFATFADGPSTIENLQDLIEQTKENAAELDDVGVRFVEDIALAASALYETYLSSKEITESGAIHDEKLKSLKNELDVIQHRVQVNSKEIKKLSNLQDAVQSMKTELEIKKIEAEMVVNRLEYDALQLKLNAKQSARAQRAYQDAQDRVGRSKDRVRSLDAELVIAEEEAVELAIELEKVEEVNAQDMRSLSELKKEVKELAISLLVGHVFTQSVERMIQLEETAVQQRRALCDLHDRLLNLTYRKMMEKIDSDEEKWLKMLEED